MFGNLGVGEIIIIAAIALVVLGPEKFPEFAKIALRAYRDFRGYIDDIRKDLAEELHPVKRELQQLAQYNPEDYVETLAKAVTGVDKEPEEPAKTTGQETKPEQNATPPAATEPAQEPKAEETVKPEEPKQYPD